MENNAAGNNREMAFKFVRIAGIIIAMVGAVMLAWMEDDTMQLVGGILVFVGISDIGLGTFLLKRHAG